MILFGIPNNLSDFSRKTRTYSLSPNSKPKWMKPTMNWKPRPTNLTKSRPNCFSIEPNKIDYLLMVSIVIPRGVEWFGPHLHFSSSVVLSPQQVINYLSMTWIWLSNCFYLDKKKNKRVDVITLAKDDKIRLNKKTTPSPSFRSMLGKSWWNGQ